MALRLWNQTSCARFLKHGVFKSYYLRNRSTAVLARTTKRQAGEESSGAHDTGVCSTAEHSKGSCPPAGFPRIRPAVRSQLIRALRHVARTSNAGIVKANKRYQVRVGTKTNNGWIQAMKRDLEHREMFAANQPSALAPFGSKNRKMSTRATSDKDFYYDEDAMSMISHDSMAEKGRLIPPDLDEREMIRASRSARSLLSARSMRSVHTLKSAESLRSRSLQSVAAEPEPVVTNEPPAQNRSDHMLAGPSEAGPSHIGYGFTKLPIRTHTTYAAATKMPRVVSILAPSKRGVHCKGGKKVHPCEPIIKPVDPYDCRKKKNINNNRALFPNVYKTDPDDLWDKCECCPEMLPCDQDTCVNTYPFPCICDDPPGMCPIDCPPPCEWPPPPPVPLCRPPKCPVYQKQKECPQPCPPLPCAYIEKKKLPPIHMGCKCVEPFLPHYNPPLKLKKRKAYQCQEECEETNYCPEFDSYVEPKRLPPIIPGNCPCIEPRLRDVPPLRRLNLNHYQKQPECPEECKEEIETVKCVVRKKLPKIRSDCVCIEPPPLKPVPLVRLPPICVCPEPPDPKCVNDECPPLADELCKWQFPKKKLKRWWPDCKIPKSKYKFCRCHTRGHKDCKRPHNRRCMCTLTALPFSAKQLTMDTNTCTVRQFSSFARAPVRGLHTGMPLSQRKKKKDPSGMEVEMRMKCKPKKTCGPICGTVCCEPRARDSCEIPLPPLCCRVKRSPYPAFSECGEFSELLTCECKHTMPYLQPNRMPPIVNKNIAPVYPVTGVIDPTDEEFCVLNDLCRPKGITYTCETFHQGEPIPITQYECFSPHRLPCCERDQICDFSFRPSERFCDGRKKEKEFYRCECACHKKNKCSPKKKHKLDSVYSKIRKHTPRHYSTMSGARQFSTLTRQNLQFKQNSGPNDALPSTSSGVTGYQSVAHYAKRPPPRVGGHTECPDECPKCDLAKKCPKLKTMKRGLPGPLKDLRKRENQEMDSAVATKLKEHFKRSQDCMPQSAGARRNKLMAEAKCAAKRVGMKLVCDHSACCKTKECKLKSPSAGGKCGGIPECKRPKNVCCECDPRYEVDECQNRRWVADCCTMPHHMSGAEFRSLQPPCCKMPLPPCSENCMRVRGDCEKDYVPCCVIEAPFPAFSDCHPPFKRPIHSECMCALTMQRKSTEAISKMLSPANLKKAQTEKYSTRAGMMPVIMEEGPEVTNTSQSVASNLHDPANCKCVRCMSMRPTAAAANHAVPDNQGAIDNIPLGLFTKDDIFKQVDKENLISLAPEVMSSLDKVKSYFFNKANVIYAQVPPVKLPVDGFECFVTPSSTKAVTQTASFKSAGASRNYSTSKPADDIHEEAVDPNDEDLKKVLPSDENVIELSSTAELAYVLEDGTRAVKLRQVPSGPQKVKVVRSPVCTHIMLDSGELLLEAQYHLMTTLMPMKNRLYLPYGLSHEEYTALEERDTKNIQDNFEKIVKIEGM